MSRYKVRRVRYESWAEGAELELIGMSDAAAALRMSLPGVIAAINRGELEEVIDDAAPHRYRNRRFVTRSSLVRAMQVRGLVQG